MKFEVFWIVVCPWPIAYWFRECIVRELVKIRALFRLGSCFQRGSEGFLSPSEFLGANLLLQTAPIGFDDTWWPLAHKLFRFHLWEFLTEASLSQTHQRAHVVLLSFLVRLYFKLLPILTKHFCEPTQLHLHLRELRDYLVWFHFLKLS